MGNPSSLVNGLEKVFYRLTIQEFRDKYSCESIFLQYYQVVSAIAKHLRSLAKCSDTINRSFVTGNDNIISLNESTQINLYKAKSKGFS